jgi:prefoldin subunit 5
MVTFKTDIAKVKINATEIDGLIKQLKEIKKQNKKTFTVHLREEAYAPGNENDENYDWVEAANKIFKKRNLIKAV